MILPEVYSRSPDSWKSMDSIRKTNNPKIKWNL